jgi:type IV pilus assembly protein PilZ
MSELPGGLPAPIQATEGGATQFAALQPGAGVTAPSGTGTRPTVIQLVFREKSSVYASYMPFLAQGGLFVPTTRDYKLGDDIYLLVTLPNDPQKYPVVGQVAWITPAGSSGGRTQGVGVQLPPDEKTLGLRQRIDELLGTSVSGSRPTQTL